MIVLKVVSAVGFRHLNLRSVYASFCISKKKKSSAKLCSNHWPSADDWVNPSSRVTWYLLEIVFAAEVHTVWQIWLKVPYLLLRAVDSFQHRQWSVASIWAITWCWESLLSQRLSLLESFLLLGPWKQRPPTSVFIACTMCFSAGGQYKKMRSCMCPGQL